MPDFFGENSPYLTNPLLTPERTVAEVDFVISQLSLQPNASVLDVGCAFGRHSIELARRGFQVTGIDPAKAMIDAAKERAKVAQVETANLERANLERASAFPYFEEARAESYQTDQQFDAIIALFTVLGQIEDDGDNRGLLANAAKALKPNGQILVEVPQRDPYKATLAPQSRFGNDERYTQITRRYLDEGNVLVEEFELGSPEGPSAFTLSFRLFDKHELEQLLLDAGFREMEWFANYKGEQLQPDSPFMLVQAWLSTGTG